MRKKLILILFFIPVMGVAQILNVEKSKLSKKDTTNYFVSTVSASVSLYNRSAGELDPVNLFGFNFAADLAYFSQKHAYILLNKYDYLSINDNVFLSTGYTHFRTRFNHKEKFHFEAFAQYQYDNFRGLDPRRLVGGSFRYRAVQTDKFDLTFGFGGFFEDERWRQPYIEGQVESVQLLKTSNYANFRWEPNDYININGIAFYQTGYDDSINGFRNRYSGELNLLVKVTERLSFVTRFEGAYEDRPIVPITRFIFSLTNGLQFRF